jgi:hypothetical protein
MNLNELNNLECPTGIVNHGLKTVLTAVGFGVLLSVKGDTKHTRTVVDRIDNTVDDIKTRLGSVAADTATIKKSVATNNALIKDFLAEEDEYTPTPYPARPQEYGRPQAAAWPEEHRAYPQSQDWGYARPQQAPAWPYQQPQPVQQPPVQAPVQTPVMESISSADFSRLVDNVVNYLMQSGGQPVKAAAAPGNNVTVTVQQPTSDQAAPADQVQQPTSDQAAADQKPAPDQGKGKSK